MKEQSLYVESDGIRLHVRQWNPEAQTTIVFVHGYPDSSHVWDQVIAHLGSDFHLVAYDVRGSGQSQVAPRIRDYSLAQLSRDFAAVIDAVSPDKPVHLVAHDWGSIQSWEPVTEPNLQHRIASYTSLSGPCLDHVGVWMRQSLLGKNGRQRRKALNQILHSWYVIMFQLPLLGPTAWKLGLDRAWPRILSRLEGIAQTDINPSQRKDGVNGVQLYRANFLPRLLKPRERHTSVPVQVMVLEDDPFVSTALLEDLARWVPRLWRFDVPTAHWLPISKPELVADYVRDFVNFINAGGKQRNRKFDAARVHAAPAAMAS